MSACSAKRSVIFPLPSSPHWAPTMTMPAISGVSLGAASPVPRGAAALPERIVLGAAGGRRSGGQDELAVAPLVVAEHRQRLAAHLVQPRDRARPDLGDQGIVLEIGREQHRP